MNALGRARQQLRYIVCASYSLLVLATTVPALKGIPHTVILPYLVIIPGYCMTFLLNRDASAFDRVFFAIAWNLALITGVVSLETTNPGLPLSVVIPGVTLAVLGYNYVHDR
ncbi:MAG: hypothetical protein OK455_04855 [Thaumarchaeota archaeon]|nr:hypothetical protein [Nitrososphaerota archaeon]